MTCLRRCSIASSTWATIRQGSPYTISKAAKRSSKGGPSMTSTAIVAGSLQAIAKRDGTDLATVFSDADAVVIFDYSYSMTEPARGGRSKYAVACDELRTLQAAHPGKIALIQFSDETMFVPGG